MSNSLDIKKQIKKFSIFKSMTAWEREKIAPIISHRDFQEKELVFAEGDYSNEIVLVNSGIFDISVQSENGEVFVASFSEGDIFGEMAFFDKHPRSATCRAQVSGQVLILNYETFLEFQGKYPKICNKILKNLYFIITNRFRNSDSFLADMVQWGEAARKRSITDTMTGLFNRRYFDDFLDTSIFNAYANGSNFTMMMMDIDNFGNINRELGNNLADQCIELFANAIQAVIRNDDIAARYGGDEFIIVLPNTTIDEANAICAQLRDELAKQISQADQKIQTVPFTISQGIAMFPEHAQNKMEIIAAADAALYSAKEAGKNQSAIFDATKTTVKVEKTEHFANSAQNKNKTDIPTITKRNKLINSVTNAFLHRKSFIIFGHKNCDEDCFGSAVSLALLLQNLQKEVTICIAAPQGKWNTLLKDMCTYNEISLLSPNSTTIPPCDTIIICDTAKHDLLDAGPTLKSRMTDTSILKIELDHHLGIDSRYIGSEGYCLVQRASSTCEIILLLCLKLQQQQELLQRLRITDILTRNIALALGIGIIADTHNGLILSTKREKRIFNAAMQIINQELASHTVDDKKITNISDLMKMDQGQSPLEMKIHRYFMNCAQKKSHIHYVILYEAESTHLASLFQHSLVQSASRNIANKLAEDSGAFGMTCYVMQPDQNNEEPIMQCRIRRNLNYHKFDLRVVLELCNVEDGGGHEGAIGFRFPFVGNDQAEKYITKIINTLCDQLD